MKPLDTSHIVSTAEKLAAHIDQTYQPVGDREALDIGHVILVLPVRVPNSDSESDLYVMSSGMCDPHKLDILCDAAAKVATRIGPDAVRLVETGEAQ